MKFKLTFLSFISSISLCALTSTFAITAQAKAPRWFEVEVILFEQLGDKRLLKEQFTREAQLPHYDSYFDLLTPYLQPDLTVLKQQLPQCQPVKKTVSEAANFITIKSLADIVAQPSAALAANTLAKITNENTLVDAGHNVTGSFGIENNVLEGNAIKGSVVGDSATDITFIDTSALPYFSGQEFCHTNAFPIKKVPTTIKPSGVKNDSHPYLIHENSLQLKDIISRLKWSKNFKPLLHLGWRQIGITRKKAIPVKIFAGEHLEQTYQQALEKQAAYNEAKVQSVSPHMHTLNAQGVLPEPSALTSQPNKMAQLQHIFDNIALIEDGALSEQAIKQLIAPLHEQTSNVDNSLADSTSPLKKPLQPWLLDGFLKIHLDHYLYISADFNIIGEALNLNESNSEIPSADKPLKAINFSQNKRVITGEVHYFDHPYIGMIVQIRRFDPTKPDDEAVTQAIR
jgi:hypothetical protein